MSECREPSEGREPLARFPPANGAFARERIARVNSAPGGKRYLIPTFDELQFPGDTLISPSSRVVHANFRAPSFLHLPKKPIAAVDPLRWPSFARAAFHSRHVGERAPMLLPSSRFSGGKPRRRYRRLATTTTTTNFERARAMKLDIFYLFVAFDVYSLSPGGERKGMRSGERILRRQ